jgi:rRNA biogenesis protein RRP5
VVAQAYDKARSVFERVATLNLSSKKMKFIFKKWLQFEKDHGTVKQQEHVKQRAVEYVESRSQK